MCEKKTVQIEVPAPPEGFEVVMNTNPNAMRCDFHFWRGEWVQMTDNPSYSPILARRKRTLADWANEQPDFQALARIFCDEKDINLYHHEGARWIFDAAFKQRQSVNLGTPPVKGILRLKNGKWVDA